MWSVLVVVPAIATLAATLDHDQQMDQMAESLQDEQQEWRKLERDPVWQGDDVVAKLESAGQHKLAAIVKAAIDDPNNPAAPALKKFANDITNEVHSSQIAAQVMASTSHHKMQQAHLLKMGQLALLGKLAKTYPMQKPSVEQKVASSFAQLQEHYGYDEASPFDFASGAETDIPPLNVPSYEDTASTMEQAMIRPDGFESDALGEFHPPYEAPQFDFEGNPTPDGSLDQLTNQLMNDAAQSDIAEREVVDSPPFSLLQSGSKTRKLSPKDIEAYEHHKAEYLAKHGGKGAQHPLSRELGGDIEEFAKKYGIPENETVVHYVKPPESQRDLQAEMKEDEKREKEASDRYSHFVATHNLPTPPTGDNGKPDWRKAEKVADAELEEHIKDARAKIEKKTGKTFDEEVASQQDYLLQKFPGMKDQILAAYGGQRITDEQAEKEKKQANRAQAGDDDDDDDESSLLQRNMRKGF